MEAADEQQATQPNCLFAYEEALSSTHTQKIIHKLIHPAHAVSDLILTETLIDKRDIYTVFDIYS